MYHARRRRGSRELDAKASSFKDHSSGENSVIIEKPEDNSIFDKQPVLASPSLADTIKKIDVIPVFDDVFTGMDAPEVPYTRPMAENYIKECLEDESKQNKVDIDFIGKTYPDIIQCKPEDISLRNLSLLRKSPSVNKYVFVKKFSGKSNEGMYHVQAFSNGEAFLVSRVEWFNHRAHHNPLSIDQDEYDEVINVYKNVINFSKDPISFYKEILEEEGIRIKKRLA